MPRVSNAGFQGNEWVWFDGSLSRCDVSRVGFICSRATTCWNQEKMSSWWPYMIWGCDESCNIHSSSKNFGSKVFLIKSWQSEFFLEGTRGCYVCVFWLNNQVGVRCSGQLADKLGPGRSQLFLRKAAMWQQDELDWFQWCGVSCHLGHMLRWLQLD